MVSLTTIFKKVYGEALEPYGFVKLKGRQPYFVKLIGDEILIVISYKNARSAFHFDGYKEFNIIGGVESVYRRTLSLDETPLTNSAWMDDNCWIYKRQHRYDYEPEDIMQIIEFSYEVGNEESMYRAMIYSLEVTKRYLLPELLKVIDLRSFLEHYRYYNPPSLGIFLDKEFGAAWGNYIFCEGLLNLKVYTPEEYAEKRWQGYNSWKELTEYKIKNGLTGLAKEDFEKEQVERKEEVRKEIAVFESLYNDPVQYARVMEELERRKKDNLKVLRTYGFEV